MASEWKAGMLQLWSQSVLKILPTVLTGFTLFMYHGGTTQLKFRDYDSCKAAITLMKKNYDRSSYEDGLMVDSGLCVPDQEEIDALRVRGQL